MFPITRGCDCNHSLGPIGKDGRIGKTGHVVVKDLGLDEINV